MPSRLKIPVKIAVSIGIIVVLLVHLEPHRFAAVLQKISVWHFVLGVWFYLAAQFLSAIRWQQLARSMRLEGELVQFYRFYLIGMFFNLFLPTAIGGDLGRAVLLARHKACTWLQAFLSIFAERLCGLGGLMIYVSLGFAWIRPSQWSLASSGFLFALTAVALFLLFCFRRIEQYEKGRWLIRKFVLQQSIEEEASSPADVWPYPKAIFLGLAISLVFHACLIGIQMLILRQLGVDISFPFMATVYGLSGLAAMIPLSLSGIGLREGSAAALLVAWGNIPKEIAIAFSLIWLCIMLAATLPGGLLLLKQQFMLTTRKKI